MSNYGSRRRFSTFGSIQLAVNGTIQKTPQKYRKRLSARIRTVAAAEERIHRMEENQLLLYTMAAWNSYVLHQPWPHKKCVREVITDAQYSWLRQE
jgi:hypothetical protein